jgi:5-methylcytosine-specific restriction protein A
MPARAARPCTRPGCENLTPTGGYCAECRSRARRAHGTSAQRGYTGPHRTRFRPGVLSRTEDKLCRCDLTDCRGHPSRPCPQPSTVADHWPLTRRQLVSQGLDPDDPARGRGLCGPCHARVTARDPRTQGGWNTP